MVRQLAILQYNQMDSCQPCQHGTAQYPQTCQRRRSIHAPPSDRLIQPAPELTLNQPRMPPGPPSDNDAAQASEMESIPPRNVYIHTPFPSVQFINLDVYSKDPE